VSLGLTAIRVGPSSARPTLSQVAMSGPSTMQPAAPAFCAISPVVVSRSKIATAFESRDATYRLVPSPDSARPLAPSSARPVPQPGTAGAAASTTHPAPAGFCVRAPVNGSRSKTATALLAGEAT
jgi:hypothetical protein